MNRSNQLGPTAQIDQASALRKLAKESTYQAALLEIRDACDLNRSTACYSDIEEVLHRVREIAERALE